LFEQQTANVADMSFETVLLDVVEGVATITLNRPAQFNALNLQMSKDLLHATIALDEDPAVRCVVITGSGKAFFAGGDLSSFGEAGDGRGALIKEMTAYFHGAISRLAAMDAPVIAKINGVAAGAGFSTMLACDIAVASSTAKFTMAYTKSGLTPDGSSTWFLPRTVGLRRAQELTLLNPTLSAQQALDWGLITRVVEAENLDNEVATLANSIANGPTKTFGGAKRLLRASADNGLETQMELEARQIAVASMSDDGREGVNAFLEKRAPRFSGR
jgi:2-(1,2-epoxy-1,2-dihydrophenyl)acetyl-CoA isomerase